MIDGLENFDQETTHFNMAIGVYDVVSTKPVSFESLEGYLEFKAYLWDVETSTSTNLGIHPCSNKDLENSFFKLNLSQKDTINFLLPAFVCLDDPSQVSLRGSKT